MVQICMVGPLYIDDDLEPKKFETLFKMPPGGPDPHLGTLPLISTEMTTNPLQV